MLQKNLLEHFWAALNTHKSAKNFVDFLQLQKSWKRTLSQIFLQKYYVQDLQSEKGVGAYTSMGANLVKYGMLFHWYYTFSLAL